MHSFICREQKIHKNELKRMELIAAAFTSRGINMSFSGVGKSQ